MCWSLPMISLLMLLVGDLRSVASLQKEIPAHRCYSCDAHRSNCSSTEAMVVNNCQEDAPFCSTTIRVSTNVSTKHFCSPESSEPCSFAYSPESHSYELTCLCQNDRCNEPPSSEIVQQLNAFIINHCDKQCDMQTFLNVTDHNMTTLSAAFNQKEINNKDGVVEKKPTTTFKPTTFEDLPKAMGMKQEVQSDDDDEEVEGSGADEDSKGVKKTASAPSAPSSFLPAAGENHANSLSPSLLILVSFLKLV